MYFFPFWRTHSNPGGTQLSVLIVCPNTSLRPHFLPFPWKSRTKVCGDSVKKQTCVCACVFSNFFYSLPLNNWLTEFAWDILMLHGVCTQSTKCCNREKAHKRRLAMNPDSGSDFWCWHRVKPWVLSVTRRDCGRKEGRLAKAKVQDQKPSRAKGNCYSFLSSASTLWGERRPLERTFQTRKGFYRML